MEWYRTDEQKPKGNKPVLGYWHVSKAFFMVIHMGGDRWYVTSGGFVSAPSWWAIPEPPV